MALVSVATAAFAAAAAAAGPRTTKWMKEPISRLGRAL
jgi:hypothetical protein